jgi:hypothetical protein
MFWLVTPAIRDRFAIRLSDALAALAVVCLAGLLHPTLAARIAPAAPARRRRAR